MESVCVQFGQMCKQIQGMCGRTVFSERWRLEASGLRFLCE